MTKRIYESKSFWTGLLTTIVSVGMALQGSELIAEYPEVVAGIGAVLGVVQIALRLVTSKPIE